MNAARIPRRWCIASPSATGSRPCCSARCTRRCRTACRPPTTPSPMSSPSRPSIPSKGARCWSRSRSAAAARCPMRTAPRRIPFGMHNNSNIPIEMIESDMPLTFLGYGLLTDSGGAGRQRGGLGLWREWRIDCPAAQLSTNLDRFKFRPFGLAGGEPGALERALSHPRRRAPGAALEGQEPAAAAGRHRPAGNLRRRRLRRPGRAAGGGGRARSRAGLCVGRAAVAPAPVRPAEE